MSRYTIDRFEDGDFVVLEDDGPRTFRIPRRWLPADAREGDVIEATERDADAGARVLHIELDPVSRDARRAQADRLRERVPKAPAGDVSL